MPLKNNFWVTWDRTVKIYLGNLIWFGLVWWFLVWFRLVFTSYQLHMGYLILKFHLFVNI